VSFCILLPVFPHGKVYSGLEESFPAFSAEYVKGGIFFGSSQMKALYYA